MRRRETVARLATLGGVVVLAWALWALTSEGREGLPWAVWPTLALLIVAALELRRAYLSGSETDSGARR
jgi:hypothetical protein